MRRRDFENPAVARQFFLRWAILQLLIGNSDARGKNLSFFVRGSGLAPAHLYDLVCVHIYGPAIEQEMAMGYGDEFRCEAVTAFDPADFAHRAALPATLVARELASMARQARRLAPGLAQDAIYTQHERERVQDIARFVVSQAERLIRIAPQVPKVDPESL